MLDDGEGALGQWWMVLDFLVIRVMKKHQQYKTITGTAATHIISIKT